jgi:hypothetical protein
MKSSRLRPMRQLVRKDATDGSDETRFQDARSTNDRRGTPAKDDVEGNMI